MFLYVIMYYRAKWAAMFSGKDIFIIIVTFSYSAWTILWLIFILQLASPVTLFGSCFLFGFYSIVILCLRTRVYTNWLRDVIVSNSKRILWNALILCSNYIFFIIFNFIYPQVMVLFQLMNHVLVIINHLLSTFSKLYYIHYSIWV